MLTQNSQKPWIVLDLNLWKLSELWRRDTDHRWKTSCRAAAALEIMTVHRVSVGNGSACWRCCGVFPTCIKWWIMTQNGWWETSDMLLLLGLAPWPKGWCFPGAALHPVCWLWTNSSSQKTQLQEGQGFHLLQWGGKHFELGLMNFWSHNWLRSPVISLLILLSINLRRGKVFLMLVEVFHLQWLLPSAQTPALGVLKSCLQIQMDSNTLSF